MTMQRAEANTRNRYRFSQVGDAERVGTASSWIRMAIRSRRMLSPQDKATERLNERTVFGWRPVSNMGNCHE